MSKAKHHDPTEQTREIVMILAGNGTTQEVICRTLKISVRTLQKHYKAELELAKDMATATVTSKLWRLIQKEDLGAIKFWLCNRAGWKTERSLQEQTLTLSEPAQVHIHLPDNGRGDNGTVTR
jgi:hypothetical protein